MASAAPAAETPAPAAVTPAPAETQAAEAPASPSLGSDSGFEVVDHPFAAQLKLLHEMGFTDMSQNILLLERFEGDLAKTATELLNVH